MITINIVGHKKQNVLQRRMKIKGETLLLLGMILKNQTSGPVNHLYSSFQTRYLQI